MAPVDDSDVGYSETSIRMRASQLPSGLLLTFAIAMARSLNLVACERPERRSDEDERCANNARHLAQLSASRDMLRTSLPELIANCQRLEDLIVNEDDEGVDILLNNALAASIYATELASSADLQLVVWIARQLYEAADYIDQHRASIYEYDASRTAARLVAQSVDALLNQLNSANWELSCENRWVDKTASELLMCM